jgi:hypothetical protein
MRQEGASGVAVVRADALALTRALEHYAAACAAAHDDIVKPAVIALEASLEWLRAWATAAGIERPVVERLRLGVPLTIPTDAIDAVERRTR